MPTQEDRVVARIKQTKAMIRDSKRITMDELEAWGYTTLGIRPRTMRKYVSALLKMKVISHNEKAQELVWNEKEI
jgi:hypothetical protein